MNSGKTLRIFFITLPCIIVCVFLYLSYHPPYDYSANWKTQKTIFFPYSDGADGGDSKISVAYDSTLLSYTYSAGNGMQYPYVGVMIFNADSSSFDVSAYTHCSITIRADISTDIPFYIDSDIQGYSTWKDVMTFYCSQNIVHITPKWNTVRLALDDFIVPNWWYKKMNQSKDKINTPDFSKVYILNFANCMYINKETPDTVQIQNITFYKDLTSQIILSFVFLCLYYGAFLLYTRKKVAGRSSKSYIYEYTKTQPEDSNNKDSRKVFEYINSNYQKQELSILDVQKNAGISERKISAIIKEHTDQNFKQFLNHLRITEAKRLLTETNMQVSEIAFQTGYGNVSHFNRVFKNIVGDSPGEYRKRV